MFYTNLLLWEKKQNLSDLFAQKKTDLFMLADLNAPVLGACKILTSRDQHSHRMVSVHHPKLQTVAMKAQLVTDPTDPSGHRADQGAQSPGFCQGAESDSSATARLGHFRAAVLLRFPLEVEW